MLTSLSLVFIWLHWSDIKYFFQSSILGRCLTTRCSGSVKTHWSCYMGWALYRGIERIDHSSAKYYIRTVGGNGLHYAWNWSSSKWGRHRWVLYISTVMLPIHLNLCRWSVWLPICAVFPNYHFICGKSWWDLRRKCSIYPPHSVIKYLIYFYFCRNTFLNVHDEDDVHIDSTMLPPTLSAHTPVHTEVIPLALQGDAAFLSETSKLYFNL